jgi:predicted dehydrogenase
MNPIRILVVGCGNMGTSHARAYHASPEFEIVGLVSRSPASREGLSRELSGYPVFATYEEALETSRPDAVSICTYPDTHAAYTKMALERDLHVFLEKPVATTVADAQELVALSRARDRKLVVGYILQHHPVWARFVEEAQKLGTPLVMRMNLNQQSDGPEWKTHQGILQSLSPIVDCGVHYVEVMCRMTGSSPVRVQAIGARLTDDLPEGQYNYGQLQVVFADGSVGWYEAGWGPMMSQTAFFVKDVVGPRGSVSIGAGRTESNSSDIDSHTKTHSLLVHSAALGAEGRFAEKDRVIETASEPGHDALCALEQDFFARAVRNEVDLTEHLDAAVRSLQIVLAADESVRTGKTVSLE